jgi:DNA-binding beta-propeller fold protein YncE
VVPIRTATNKAGKPIKVGIGPAQIAFTPDSKKAYVTNDGIGERLGNTVTPISTATGKAGKPIKVGQFPEAIAITPNSKTAYVSNNISGTVTPINTPNNKALKAIKVPYAGAIAITP